MFRQLFGTEKVLRRQMGTLEQQREMFLVMGNSLKYSSTSIDKIKKSVTYKRCLEVTSLLSPMDVKDGKYVRVGKSNDGGYIMLDNAHKNQIDAAYSFGISNDVSWDEVIADSGVDVFMYDPTIKKLPKPHPKFHFFKTGITGHEKKNNFSTLRELIANNGHATYNNMIMKMDVEGCEWDGFLETPLEVMNQFSQFMVEFHDLSYAVYNSTYSSIVAALKKINQTHQSIHIHANNGFIPLWIADLVLPGSLEVTYIRRADVKDTLIANTRQFPTEIDQPNRINWPDIYLGDFGR
jgi:hypothetical protein